MVALGIIETHPHDRHDIHQHRRFMTKFNKLRYCLRVISFIALVRSECHRHESCAGVCLRNQATWICLRNLYCDTSNVDDREVYVVLAMIGGADQKEGRVFGDDRARTDLLDAGIDELLKHLRLAHVLKERKNW